MKKKIFFICVICAGVLGSIGYLSSVVVAQPPPASVIKPPGKPITPPGKVIRNGRASGGPGSGEDIVRRRIRAQDVQRIAELEVVRNNWRGINALFPILPIEIIPFEETGRVESQFIITATARPVSWIDPEIVAVGYDYFIDDGPKVTSVEMPLNIGDNVYDLWLFDPEINDFVDSGIDISGGETYTFSEPVDKFSIRGIEVSADVAPENETTFPTGLTFESKEEVTMHVMSVTTTTGNAGL